MPILTSFLADELRLWRVGGYSCCADRRHTDFGVRGHFSLRVSGLGADRSRWRARGDAAGAFQMGAGGTERRPDRIAAGKRKWLVLLGRNKRAWRRLNVRDVYTNRLPPKWGRNAADGSRRQDLVNWVQAPTRLHVPIAPSPSD